MNTHNKNFPFSFSLFLINGKKKNHFYRLLNCCWLFMTLMMHEVIERLNKTYTHALHDFYFILITLSALFSLPLLWFSCYKFCFSFILRRVAENLFIIFAIFYGRRHWYFIECGLRINFIFYGMKTIIFWINWVYELFKRKFIVFNFLLNFYAVLKNLR